MTRYYANHILNETIFTDRAAGDTLDEAKRFAEKSFSAGIQDGELVIIDSHTVGYVTVASKKAGNERWNNLA